MQLELELEADEEVGRLICEKCGGDLGPKQPLKGTLTFCGICQKWIGNDGKEHQIRREVILKNGKRKRARVFNAEGTACYEQSEKKKGRTKKHGASRRIRTKCV